MARLARLTVKDHVHLITLNGHGREPVFRDDDDRHAWMTWMFESAQSEQVAIHGYVLLPERIRLLASPSGDHGVPRWMQAVGRRYGRYFNDRYARRGTLWDGRYRCTIVDPVSYLLPAMVFMDLEPVREGLVADASEYPWSSHRHYLGHLADRFLVPPAAYWSLGNTPFAREAAYGALIRSGLNDREIRAIDDAAAKGWVLGSSLFADRLQQQVSRRITPLSPGRPPKQG